MSDPSYIQYGNGLNEKRNPIPHAIAIYAVPGLMISRRRFIKDSMLGTAALAFLPIKTELPPVQFPIADKLGRVTVGMAEIKLKPDADSTTIGKTYEDAVVPWLREVVGRRPYRRSQRWVETPQGYI